MLGALDDKIALNQRMAATLETLGRFTYREWRETLPQTDRRPIRDVCQVSSGGTPARRSAELWEGPIPWISPKAMTSIHCDEPEEWVSPSAIGRGTRLAPAGSTLVMVRGMGLHERVRVSQAREDVTFNQDVKSLTPMDLEPAMLLFSVLDAQEELLARVESSGHGTGVLPTSALTSHLVAAPKADVRRAMAERLELLNARIGLARSEARTLAALRDALLPRLLGGPEMR
jgi:type I restriction enzyme S subunit